jgi:hypothetical protein
MKLRQFLFLFFLLNIILFICSCKTLTERKTENQQDSVASNSNINNQQMVAHAPIIIYKTSKDYFKNVPVSLSDDKNSVVSFPDIYDVFYNGELAYPTKLARGYLLDNRGIGPNSAFLSYTYEEYSRMEATPSPDILIKMITDKYPFTEMYQLGCKRDTCEINKLITSGLKKNCKKIQ